MVFEWDPDKERINRKKHSGLDFEIASRVFADSNFPLRKDRVVDGERRWHAIGAVQRGDFQWRRNHPNRPGPRGRFARAPSLSGASR
jgi:uncharacterized DUF497 family protein